MSGITAECIAPAVAAAEFSNCVEIAIFLPYRLDSSQRLLDMTKLLKTIGSR